MARIKFTKDAAGRYVGLTDVAGYTIEKTGTKFSWHLIIRSPFGSVLSEQWTCSKASLVESAELFNAKLIADLPVPSLF